MWSFYILYRKEGTLSGIDANIGIRLSPPSLRAEGYALTITERQTKGSICTSGDALTSGLSEEIARTGEDARICGVIAEVVEIGAVEVTDVKSR